MAGSGAGGNFLIALDRSLSEILQILSLTLFEKTPVFSALTAPTDQNQEYEIHKQLSLFNF